MFRSLSEDRDYLRQVLTPWRGMEPIEEALHYSPFALELFCLIFSLVQRNAPGNQYYIRCNRAFYNDYLKALEPYSFELGFWGGESNSPINYVWLKDNLISWHRNREEDRALVGVDAIKSFIKNLHGI